MCVQRTGERRQSSTHERLISSARERSCDFHHPSTPYAASSSSSASGGSAGAPPTLSSRYRLVQPIGRGSCGVCYLAEELQTRKFVVVKQISLSSFSSGGGGNGGVDVLSPELQHAWNEVKMLKNLRHSNVVKYFGSFLEEKRNTTCLEDLSGRGGSSKAVFVENIISIAMEYADKGDLAEEIKRRRHFIRGKPLPPQCPPIIARFVSADFTFRSLNGHFQGSDIWLIFIQICIALKFIHSQRILHRDIKTRNIFLTNSGIIKIGDFGIAKQLYEDMATTMVGSPHFMAPEVHRQLPYNEKSDMWSLGCVLYEIVNFRHVFKGEALPFILKEISAYERNPLRTIEEWRSTMSPEFAHICSVLLKVHPVERPTVNQLLEMPEVIGGIKQVVENYPGKQFASIHELWAQIEKKCLVHPLPDSSISTPRAEDCDYYFTDNSNKSSKASSSVLDESIISVRHQTKIITRVVTTTRRRHPTIEEIRNQDLKNIDAITKLQESLLLEEDESSTDGSLSSSPTFEIDFEESISTLSLPLIGGSSFSSCSSMSSKSQSHVEKILHEEEMASSSASEKAAIPTPRVSKKKFEEVVKGDDDDEDTILSHSRCNSTNKEVPLASATDSSSYVEMRRSSSALTLQQTAQTASPRRQPVSLHTRVLPPPRRLPSAATTRPPLTARVQTSSGASSSAAAAFRLRTKSTAAAITRPLVKSPNHLCSPVATGAGGEMSFYSDRWNSSFNRSGAHSRVASVEVSTVAENNHHIRNRHGITRSSLGDASFGVERMRKQYAVTSQRRECVTLLGSEEIVGRLLRKLNVCDRTGGALGDDILNLKENQFEALIRLHELLTSPPT